MYDMNAKTTNCVLYAVLVRTENLNFAVNGRFKHRQSHMQSVISIYPQVYTKPPTQPTSLPNEFLNTTLLNPPKPGILIHGLRLLLYIIPLQKFSSFQQHSQLLVYMSIRVKTMTKNSYIYMHVITSTARKEFVVVRGCTNSYMYLKHHDKFVIRP